MKSFIKKYMPNSYKIASNLKYKYFFYQYYKILKNLDSLMPPNKIEDKRIIFNLVRSYATGILFFESSLAIKLREYGAKVNVLIDDGILRHHDTVQYENFIKNNNLNFPKIKTCNNFLKKISLYKEYSEFINKKDLVDVSLIAESLIKNKKYFYKNINLKPYIDASLVRFYQAAAGFTEKESNCDKIEKICTENAIISALVASKVEELLDPDIVVTSHGIYSTWGPFYEYFKQKNKKVITYGFSGYINNGVIFSKKGLVANRCDDEFFDAYKDKIDINLAEKNIKDIFDRRFNGKSADLISFGNFTEDDNLLRKIKNIACRMKIFALFPNVLWDNSLTNTKNIFSSSVESLIETIRFFMRQDDKVLIIRAHPSEANFMRARISTKEIIESKINKNISDIKNIIYIPSNNSLRSYSLFPFIKGGVVYNGTIGLEMMYKKIPVLIAGKAPYSNKGFTINFKNKKEYFDAFNQIEKVLEYQEKNRGSLIKFLFYYFTLNEIPLSFLDEKKPAYPKLNYIPSMILNDKNLKYIAETILDKHDFFQEWHWNES